MWAFLPVIALLAAVVAAYHLVTTLLHGRITLRGVAGLPEPRPEDAWSDAHSYDRRFASDGQHRGSGFRAWDLTLAGLVVPAGLAIAVIDLHQRGTAATALAAVAAIAGILGLWGVLHLGRRAVVPPVAVVACLAVALGGALAGVAFVDVDDVDRPWELSFAWMAAASAVVAVVLAVRALRRVSSA